MNQMRHSTVMALHLFTINLYLSGQARRMKRSTDRAASVWRETAIRKMSRKPNAPHAVHRVTSSLPKTNSLALPETIVMNMLDTVTRKSTSAKLKRNMLPGSLKRWCLKAKERRMNPFQLNAITKKMAITTATAGDPLCSSLCRVQKVLLVTCTELIVLFRQLNISGAETLDILGSGARRGGSAGWGGGVGLYEAKNGYE